MTEVVSIKFKSSGKNYYFSPEGIRLREGDKVIVETAKGLEIAECAQGNRMVEDAAIVKPLRPVIRIATEQDKRTEEQNRLREKEAFGICQKKIEEHGLEMKLVDVECCFDGSKTLFFFTADGRVDFRELVKDLASIFHNRIELRQIGVRDEAKMLGGIGICGRPYCCHSFLNDFAPVSTKMAKIQNLSLNPAKISGSCGRLMCCLRYEEEAYEELVKNVPKQGAFVETTAGYGTAISVDLLRQMVKVHLEGESDDTTHLFKAAEVATVPGGHPKEGEPYPKVLHYVPEEEEVVEEEDPWAMPSLFAEEQKVAEVTEGLKQDEEEQKEEPSASHNARRHRQNRRPNTKKPAKKPAESEEKKEAEGKAASPQHAQKPRRQNGNETPSQKKGQTAGAGNPPKKEKQPASSARAAETSAAADGTTAPEKKKSGNRRRYYHRGKKPSGGNHQPTE
ncbi:MAG: stage 0 sporulation family protein [Oscillospiraceae bacterium]|nr:stage 0 sporulation family protein [Oscillospiraceae bacterium]